MEEVIERNGKTYEFDRHAFEDEDGCISLSQLRDDVCVIAPGLIYREVKAA